MPKIGINFERINNIDAKSVFIFECPYKPSLFSLKHLFVGCYWLNKFSLYSAICYNCLYLQREIKLNEV